MVLRGFAGHFLRSPEPEKKTYILLRESTEIEAATDEFELAF